VIRQKFGDKSLDQLLNIKVEEIPILAWAGLKHEDKVLTVEQVEDLLDDAIPEKYTMLKVTEIVLEALANQMGVDTKKVAADLKKAKAGDQGKEPEELLVMAVTAAKKQEEEKPQPTETIPSTKKQKK